MALERERERERERHDRQEKVHLSFRAPLIFVLQVAFA